MSITNTAKPVSGVTWAADTNTWAQETRTWASTATTITNVAKPS